MLDVIKDAYMGILPDVIIGSDLTYDDAHHAALCDTLRRLPVHARQPESGLR